MELFSLRGDLNFHWVRPVDNVSWPWRGGVPVTGSWPEPSLTLSDDDAAETFLPVDCLPLNAGTDGLIVSSFAREVLGEQLLASGELLPVKMLGHAYWWFNCLAKVQALDQVTTEADWEVVNGDWGEFRWITALRKLAFVPDVVASAPAVFRVPEFPQGVLFAGGDFARTVSLQRLTGFRFDLVWSEADGGVREPAGFGLGDAFEATDAAALARKRSQARLVLLDRRAHASGRPITHVRLGGR